MSDKEQAESIERQESVLIKEQSAKLQEALEEINRLNLKIKEIEKQENKQVTSDKEVIKKLKKNNEELINERKELLLKIKCLDETVKCLEDRLKLFKKQERDVSAKMSSLQVEFDEEIKSLKSNVDIAVSEKNNYRQIASDVTEQLKSTQRELEDTKHLLSMTESHFHGNQENGSFSTVSPDVLDQLLNYQKLLERTERELFEARTELNTKKEELVVLRDSHDKRLTRMRSLNESHGLLLQQIKTYESSASELANQEPILLNKGRSPVKRDHTLQHENTAELWSQLVAYRNKCEELERLKLEQEEEIDCLKATCSRNKTIINELKSFLEEKQYMISQRDTALHQLRRVASCSSLEREREEEIRNKLRNEIILLNEENRLLRNDCYKSEEMIHSLQLTINELQATPPAPPTYTLNKSTNTDQISVTDSCVQVNLMTRDQETPRLSYRRSFSAHALIDQQTHSHTAQSHSHTVQSHSQTAHRRRYSEGDILTSYHLLSRAIDKLSQSIHAPPIPAPPTAPPPIVRQSVPNQSTHMLSADKKHSKTTCSSSCSSHSSSAHKCKWHHQLKIAHQRIKSLTQQVAVLTDARAAAVKSLEEAETEREKCECQMKPLQDKVASQKGIIQSLKEDMKLLENSYHELQGRCSGLETAFSVGDNRGTREEDIKQFRTEKKLLNERCSTLSDQLKVLQTELSLIEKERESLQERCCYMERDLKNKRQYMNELKKKISHLENKSSTDNEKISHLSDHVITLQQSVEQYRHRITSMKTQSEFSLKEKEKLRDSLTQAKEELKASKLQLRALQEESQRKLSVYKENEEKKDRHRKTEYELIISELEETIKESRTIISHYQQFIKDLAKEVSELHRQEKLTQGRGRGGSKSEEKVSERARKIAKDAFNLSETEVDQFMNSQADEGGDLTLIKSVTKFIDQKGVNMSSHQLLTDFMSSISLLNSHQKQEQ